MMAAGSWSRSAATCFSAALLAGAQWTAADTRRQPLGHPGWVKVSTLRISISAMPWRTPGDASRAS
jgi:hypothetical protein